MTIGSLQKKTIQNDRRINAAIDSTEMKKTIRRGIQKKKKMTDVYYCFQELT